ncbi:methionyl-tRNA formyltransferase [Anaeromyxobacter paludicola]|uniref:Methionyl-tRNA formyltransferase n=1 Tax=Anaeromyxobacter paludicola TaxID=2918171 RepID=A0ABM7XBR1_9BACT|nr:methionyl-tRNA formyltransferase [Anaeromyxobacter paludicola]BDG09267.1 methionyl-tRNA formyltransferase [Anaeromyxobacter paludicola]
MKIAFLGTPPFAVAALEALAAAGHELACVVAQPDRPAGRGQELRAPATKVWAEARGVPVLQPEKVRDGQLAAALGALAPDVLVVVAYGRILGKDLLELAPHGAVNVHASLLPRLRGAAPIQWSLAEGDRETGVSIMQMDEGLDTGDVLLQRVLPIEPADTAETLSERLSRLGGAALVEALGLLAEGRIVPAPQDHTQATLAPIIQKEHGRLDFQLPAEKLVCRLRGFTPWPGAYTTLGGKTLKVHAARATHGDPVMRPGTAQAMSSGLFVACGGGTAILVTELQLEGRKRMSAADFLKGQPVPAGTVLG